MFHSVKNNVVSRGKSQDNGASIVRDPKVLCLFNSQVFERNFSYILNFSVAGLLVENVSKSDKPEFFVQ